MLNSALFNGYLLSEAAARGPCKVLLFFGLLIIIAVSARKNNVFFSEDLAKPTAQITVQPTEEIGICRSGKAYHSHLYGLSCYRSSTQARTAQIASTSMSRAKERLPVIWRPVSRTVRRMR